MKSLLPIILFLLATLLGCNSSKKPLNDFIKIDSITKATIHNNHGSFDLNSSQLVQLKKELKLLTEEKELTVKVGMKGVIITINQKDYHIEGQTHGKYVDISGIGCFNTNGLNFDNYKPK